MAIKAQQLFLDKFIALNQTRYAQDPTMLALFDNLKLTDVTIGAITKDSATERTIAKIDSAARNFTSEPQHFNAAPFENSKVSTTIAAADLAEIQAKTTAGVYSYTDTGVTKLVVVVDSATATGAAEITEIKNLLIAAGKYEIVAGDITATLQSGKTDAWDVEIDSDIIIGTLTAIKGQSPVITIPETDYGDLV